MGETYLCRNCGHRHTDWDVASHEACHACGRRPVTLEEEPSPEYSSDTVDMFPPSAPSATTAINFDAIAESVFDSPTAPSTDSGADFSSSDFGGGGGFDGGGSSGEF